MNAMTGYKKILLNLALFGGAFLLVSLFLGGGRRHIASGPEEAHTAGVLTRVSLDAFPAVSAESVIVERMGTGEVLFAKDPERQLAPASLTKLMTALLFVAAVDPLDTVRVPQEAEDILQGDEKRAGVYPGDTFKAEDLLKLTIAASDNDAAYAAANAAALREGWVGTDAAFTDRISVFADHMNREAGALGLAHTHFASPSGRDSPETYSTAADLAKLAGAVYRTAPRVWDTSRLVEGNVYSAEGRVYHFTNTNPLLKEFPAIYGTKTGFTDEAGEALLMLYQLRPRDPIAVVILKSGDRFGDGRAILAWLDRSFKIQ